MFTGIIESIGSIVNIEGNIFTITHNFDEDLKIGESIALNGMCATIIDTTSERSFKTLQVEIMAESRNLTNFGTAKIGDRVNLERSAKIGDRNSGHFVLGHIDEIGKIIDRKCVKDFELFRVAITSPNYPLIVQKGSIALDGISLTISELSKNPKKTPWFEVSIISHTLKNTNFGSKKTGDQVNLEYDVLGKYILRQTET